jgi:hypothetical protein
MNKQNATEPGVAGLASQDSAEITLQAVYNLLMRLVDLFVGEGALRRLEAD